MKQNILSCSTPRSGSIAFMPSLRSGAYQRAAAARYGCEAHGHVGVLAADLAAAAGGHRSGDAHEDDHDAGVAEEHGEHAGHDDEYDQRPALAELDAGEYGLAQQHRAARLGHGRAYNAEAKAEHGDGVGEAAGEFGRGRCPTSNMAREDMSAVMGVGT